MTQNAEYSEEFYADLAGTATPSARAVAPFLLNAFPLEGTLAHTPNHVVDVGCGTGGWLRAMLDGGVASVTGVDGDWAPRERLLIPPDAFRAHDIGGAAAPLPDGIPPARMALCLEVAEHAPPARAAGLVAGLCALAPVVVFAAAIPAQGGVGHVNERWPEYWAALFADHGYAAHDMIRPRFWRDARITWWYRQNTLVYARRDTLWAAMAARHAPALRPEEVPALVHPELYAVRCREAKPKFGAWSKALPAVIRRTWGRRA